MQIETRLTWDWNKEIKRKLMKTTTLTCRLEMVNDKDCRTTMVNGRELQIGDDGGWEISADWRWWRSRARCRSAMVEVESSTMLRYQCGLAHIRDVERLREWGRALKLRKNERTENPEHYKLYIMVGSGW